MVTLQQIKPLEIEAESFRIIEREFAEATDALSAIFTRRVCRDPPGYPCPGDFGFSHLTFS